MLAQCLIVLAVQATRPLYNKYDLTECALTGSEQAIGGLNLEYHRGV